jgi:type IV secretory pathway TrbD component
MTGTATAAFDCPPRGFVGLPERLAERRLVMRCDDRCPLCGGADPLRLGSCFSCAGRSGERLIFLMGPRTDSDRLNNLQRVRALLPLHAPAFEVALVVDGHLALAAVPDPALGNVEAALRGRGLAVRSLSTVWNVAPMPRPLSVQFGLLISVAIWGGLVTSPWVSVIAASLGAGLWILAQRYLRHPATADPDRRPWLVLDDEGDVIGTLTSLPRGRAKSLLVELVRLGRLLHTRARIAGDSGVAEDTASLIVAAAHVAGDLAHMRRLSEALLPSDGDFVGDESEPDVAGRLDALAVPLEGLLLTAIGRLGGGARGALTRGHPLSELSVLVHELDRSRSAYRTTIREAETLLREGS